MNVAPAVPERLQNIRLTRRFVTGLARMKGLGEAYADELSELNALWTEAHATGTPGAIRAAREYEAALLRHISHLKAVA